MLSTYAPSSPQGPFDGLLACHVQWAREAGAQARQAIPCGRGAERWQDPGHTSDPRPSSSHRPQSRPSPVETAVVLLIQVAVRD